MITLNNAADNVRAKTFEVNSKIFRVEWMGFELAVFDVTDPENPIEVQPKQQMLNGNGTFAIEDVLLNAAGTLYVTFKFDFKKDMRDIEIEAGEFPRWSKYPAIKFNRSPVTIPFENFITP